MWRKRKRDWVGGRKGRSDKGEGEEKGMIPTKERMSGNESKRGTW